MTIWTAVTMTDIEYDAEAGTGIPFPGLNVTQTIGNGSETRLISTTDTGRMLGAGWGMGALPLLHRTQLHLL